MLTVDGPITRNGGGCSYGSIDHRNMMINAANHPLCRGHIFIINTPGGSAWAKNDYEQAINYARSQGQPVIAFVDGLPKPNQQKEDNRPNKKPAKQAA